MKIVSLSNKAPVIEKIFLISAIMADRASLLLPLERSYEDMFQSLPLVRVKSGKIVEN